ncbi:MAG: hypothetical protein JSR37_02270 [Verrucomicrobia bacterium]|nr:hypothetical protein [Verrucomicrobiota bacterium]MBS0636416.1 hypothetical protein [Verrucomicrobiota bacterium]
MVKDTKLAATEEKRMNDAMHLFRDSYNNGYKIIIEELKKNTQDNVKAYQAKADGLKMLDNPQAFKKFLAEGKSVSDMLGFSPESIDKFYEAAHHLMAQKRFKEAKDAFFFLVTVAPQVSECWLGLGLAYGQCKEAEGAIQSYLRAIALSPHKADGYIAFARLFTALNDIPNAQKVCDIGMSFVKEHEKQAWAQELERALKETRQELSRK